MKNLIFTAIFISIGFFMYGCDSPTETKATPVTTAPSLLAPNDGASGISFRPLFKWNGAANKIQIDFNNTFNPPGVYDFSGLNGVSEYELPPGVISTSGTYHWRVGVVSSGSTNWSTSFRFTTQ